MTGQADVEEYKMGPSQATYPAIRRSRGTHQKDSRRAGKIRCRTKSIASLGDNRQHMVDFVLE
jgi:hypothetical protein